MTNYYAKIEDAARKPLEAEVERYRALAKKLSDVLLTIAPLGGSECFMRIGDEFFAEPEFFKSRIAELHASRHEAMKRAVRAEKAAVAATNRNAGG